MSHGNSFKKKFTNKVETLILATLALTGCGGGGGSSQSGGTKKDINDNKNIRLN
jgi:hypothetical protein